ncbi:MAG TPA: glycosyltransferase family 9 protein, partial [Terriglobia bacterium]|nr:glycosyltransferase family 9 protein [Terriglobia bacterium]
MSSAIHSLHQANPGKFLTAVDTSANQLYDFNPDVSVAEDDFERIEMHYPAIHKSDQRAIHFMQGYCEFLSDVLGVSVPLLTNRPLIYLSKQERSWMNQVQELTGRKQRFWIVCAGRKNDFTTKFWGTENFQRVVDSLRGRVLFVQVGATEHYHPPLRNVLDLRGKTDMRQLVRLAWHADGILSGVTFLQHLASALEKPSVVVMGGREPVPWNT